MTFSNTTAQQITSKWASAFESKPMKVGKSERKGFKHQIKINHHLKWPEVVEWMEQSFGPGGNRKSWSCDWASLFGYGRARDEFKYRLKYTFNVYLSTDEQLSHFLLTWDAK